MEVNYQTWRVKHLTYSANSKAQGSFLPVESTARSESETACTCIFHCSFFNFLFLPVIILSSCLSQVRGSASKIR
jgi:hypothetical protein